MTHLTDRPDEFAASAIRGYCDIHARTARQTQGGVKRATLAPAGKVAVVVGGGGGHYPAFAGFVGVGMADAAVPGDVFASPSARAVRAVSIAASRGAGVLLCIGNYAGDVLNFGLAATQLAGDGIDARVLAVTDDIASAPAGEMSRRRGIAGNLAVFKIAGAIAEAGAGLDEVEHMARLANARTRTLGVAFGGCTLPGAEAPLFVIPRGRMAVGLGIHGEPGIEEMDLLSAQGIASLMVTRLLAETPEPASRRVGAILNGLGGTKQEELFVLWDTIAGLLRDAGLRPVAPLVGEFTTSLDMEGCSLSLIWLDDTLEPLWLAPCDTPVLHVGNLPVSVAAEIEPELSVDAVATAGWKPASDASRDSAAGIAAILDSLSRMLAGAEAELGRIDAAAGDGDHGQGMARGSAAAAAAGMAASREGAGAASVLGAAADAWADRAGGTSGALWGVGLHAASRCLNDNEAAGGAQLARGTVAALQAVTALGGARPGDKTLVDALEPFAHSLCASLEAGTEVRAAWSEAARAAERGAEATAAMLPRRGRASHLPERSRGHRDAGAVSLALCARHVLACLEGGVPAA